jgi:glycosyltransferase involved in cell wall biosynthesis
MGLSDPLVSVVIPTHNRDVLVGRAIASGLAQSYPQCELIVVDDASSDGTSAVVAGFAAEGVRYMRHADPRGGAAARNTGIQAAAGRLIAFLDDDDEWLPDKLARQVEVFRSWSGRPKPIVYTGLHYVDETGTIVQTLTPQKEGWILPDLLFGNYVGSASTVLVEREALLAVGGFDEALESCQDWDLWICLAAKRPFVALPDPLVKHYAHPERIDTNLAAQIQGRLRLLGKITPQLQQLGAWRRRCALANHYLLMAGCYAAHNRRQDARTWLLRSLIQNPANPYGWHLLATRLISV